MEMNFGFNWPPGESAVTVEVGVPTVNDGQYTFRVGVIKADDLEHIRYGQWQSSDAITGLKFVVRSGDKVRLEKKSGSEHRMIEIDTAERWPAEAYGASTTYTSFGFGN